MLSPISNVDLSTWVLMLNKVIVMLTRPNWDAKKYFGGWMQNATECLQMTHKSRIWLERASIISSDGHCLSSTSDKSSVSLWEARNNGSTSQSTDSSILPSSSYTYIYILFFSSSTAKYALTRSEPFLFPQPTPVFATPVHSSCSTYKTPVVVLEAWFHVGSAQLAVRNEKQQQQQKLGTQKMTMPGSFCVVRWRCGILLPLHETIPAAVVQSTSTADRESCRKNAVLCTTRHLLLSKHHLKPEAVSEPEKVNAQTACKLAYY